MSDPIRSISQNNFILADQKEVSHDNTLSGNGTEESPLGLNETVLYDGGSTPVYSADMTEAATNFERLRLEISPEGSSRGYASFIEIDPNANRRIWDLGICNGEGNAWLSIIRTKLSDDGLTLTTDYRKAISFGAYTSTSTATTATSTANPTCILKIVGINRIANN